LCLARANSYQITSLLVTYYMDWLELGITLNTKKTNNESEVTLMSDTNFNELKWFDDLGKAKEINNKVITHTLISIPMKLEIEIPKNKVGDELYIRKLTDEILDLENNTKVDNYFNVFFDFKKKVSFKYYNKTKVKEKE